MYNFNIFYTILRKFVAYCMDNQRAEIVTKIYVTVCKWLQNENDIFENVRPECSLANL